MAGVKYTQDELEKRVKHMARAMFGWDVTFPVIISTRMTRSWGAYCWQRSRKDRTITPKAFKFSARLVSSGKYSAGSIDDVIKHELIHWYTNSTEKTNCGHSKKFYENCQRFGANPKRINSYEKV